MRRKSSARKLAEKAKAIEGLTIEIQALAGEEDRIFGSVTTANIAEKLNEMGHAIDRKSILLEEPIKALGIFAVPVRLASGIEASVESLGQRGGKERGRIASREPAENVMLVVLCAQR